MNAALIGLVGGFVNGLLGSGGGTLLVPSMERFMKVESHKAHATAIIIILPLSIVSAVVYLWGERLDWLMIAKISLGGVAGGFVGAKLLNKISGKWLHKIFGIIILVGAFNMIR